MKFTKPPKSLKDNLGLAQQCWHMANAACEALGLTFDDVSPSEIFERVEQMNAALVFVRNYARDSRTGRMMSGEGYAMVDEAIVIKPHSWTPFTTRDGSQACAKCDAPKDHECHRGHWLKTPCDEHKERFELECPACNGKNSEWVPDAEPQASGDPDLACDQCGKPQWDDGSGLCSWRAGAVYGSCDGKQVCIPEE